MSAFSARASRKSSRQLELILQRLITSLARSIQQKIRIGAKQIAISLGEREGFVEMGFCFACSSEPGGDFRHDCQAPETLIGSG